MAKRYTRIGAHCLLVEDPECAAPYLITGLDFEEFDDTVVLPPAAASALVNLPNTWEIGNPGNSEYHACLTPHCPGEGGPGRQSQYDLETDTDLLRCRGCGRYLEGDNGAS